MNEALFYSLIALVLVSLVSLSGILILYFNKKFLSRALLFIVAFSAGTLLATAFLDLIPEVFESLENVNYVIIGILFFFIIESLIHWHHSHEKECGTCVKPVAYLNLIGDAFHNFVDGVIVVSSFLVSIPTGIIATIAICLHEIPQELGDFGVLIHSGLTRKKALLYNFLISLSAIFGGVLSYFFLSKFEFLIPYAISFAAGGFIYIASTDLFPELHKERNKVKIVIQMIALILGITLIWILFRILPHV